MISVFIDADNCPTLVLDFVAKYCKQHNFNLIIVANKKVEIQNAEYKMVVCEQTKNAADNYIFENATEKDLVITKDILLVERLVGKNIVTINDRGTMFDKNSIKYRIQDRNLNLQLSALGFGGKKERNFSEKMLNKFENCITKAISILRGRDSQ